MGSLHTISDAGEPYCDPNDTSFGSAIIVGEAVGVAEAGGWGENRPVIELYDGGPYE